LILDEATSAIDVRGEKIVQAALDKVSQNRTTIMIAHRLSTIMKADNIVVLKKGKVVQQGTHAELLADHEGAYWALANAQHLSLGEEEKKDIEWINFDSDDAETLVLDRFSFEVEVDKSYDEPDYETRGFFGSFGSLLWEQRRHWPWYLLMLLASFGAGGKAFFPEMTPC
jgi:ATP-binding cassette subfamily B (MDR/TAP) protein 1